MSTIHYKEGKLYMESVSLETIAETCGTPVYCYSTQQIADNFHAIQTALRNVMPSSKFTICYACKANSNQAIIKMLHKLGAGADVVSVGEMYRAFKAGVSAKKIVFSGVGKKEDELSRAIKNGLLQINVESESELKIISNISTKEDKRTHIAFRVNPDIDAKTHAKITTGRKENKFGIDIETAPALYEKARSMVGIIADGVAVHIGSQLTDLKPFEEAFKRVAILVQDLRTRGHTITRVDLGGGIGINYKDEVPLDLNAYAALIRDIILPLDVHVIVEPGRAIVGNAGLLLTRVLHTKKSHDKRFLIVDAGMNDLMRPALYDAYHPILPCSEPKVRQGTAPFEVAGPVCETADTFLTDAQLPEITAAGDLLAITVAGAYGASMASNYNTRPLPVEILISDIQFDQIRKVQKIEDVVSNDIIPAWLA